MNTVILLIPALFLLMLFLPTIAFMLKARRYGAKFTIYEALLRAFRKINYEKLFKALAVVQNEGLDIKLTELETHLYAGGNPEMVVIAFLKYRNHPVVNFTILTVFDLMGKNVLEIAENGIPEYELKIIGHKVGRVQVNYSVKFMAKLYDLEYKVQLDVIENEIIQKLEQSSWQWDFQDKQRTKEFILSNVLTKSYWDDILCLNLIEQRVFVY
ncbi:flotillin-like FloA family protein [Limibacter armeniacum]|uniref:flotillin-like FloA family protein n=1 Tax=Limibacter armeniacum TaxID=466084 RepID=UPI002FE5B6C7